MPQKGQDNMKGTSPSPNIERAVDTAWNAQNKQSSTSAQEAISKQYNKNPVDVPGGKE